MSVITAWPCMAWTTDPLDRRDACLTHATLPAEPTALCGVSTPFHGDLWPGPCEPWTATHSRCPSCAQHLYTSRRP